MKLKLIYIAALFAALAFSEDAKVTNKPPEAPAEVILSDDDSVVKDLKITIMQEYILNQAYRISEWQSKHTPIIAQIQHIREELCPRVGISKEKANSGGCIIQGFADDGGPVLAPDGKPIPRKVINASAAQTVQPVDKTK